MPTIDVLEHMAGCGALFFVAAAALRFVRDARSRELKCRRREEQALKWPLEFPAAAVTATAELRDERSASGGYTCGGDRGGP